MFNREGRLRDELAVIADAPQQALKKAAQLDGKPTPFAPSRKAFAVHLPSGNTLEVERISSFMVAYGMTMSGPRDISMFQPAFFAIERDRADRVVRQFSEHEAGVLWAAIASRVATFREAKDREIGALLAEVALDPLGAASWRVPQPHDRGCLFRAWSGDVMLELRHIPSSLFGLRPERHEIVGTHESALYTSSMAMSGERVSAMVESVSARLRRPQ